MKKILLPLATAIGLVAAGSAGAQGVDFDSVDANQDGEISFEELQAVLPEITPEDFALIDTDGSGALSPDEFSVLLQAPAAPAEPLPAPEPAPLDVEPAPLP